MSRPSKTLARPLRTRPIPWLRSAVALLLGPLFTLAAHASSLEACQLSDSVLLCRLRSVLAGLETLAGILGALLIAAILLAVRAYRRKPRKLTPDDIAPDAPADDADEDDDAR